MFKQVKQHEIYFSKADYLSIADRFQNEKSQKLSQQELLLAAKGYFLQGSYAKCLKVLEIINPTQSTKVLFQRQSLKFRSEYLLKRKMLPNIEHLADLHHIIDLFEKEAAKTPGPQCQPHHFSTMRRYKDFLALIEKHIDMKIVFDNDIFKEQKILQSKARRFEGFPIYLLATQWIEDFNQVSSLSQFYLCPLTNFAIINDIFEAYHYENSLDVYKNDFIFPSVAYTTISKKYWNYLNSITNDGQEFCPVKRLANQSLSGSSDDSKRINRVHILMKVAIQYDKRIFALQLTQNKSLDGEFYELIERKFGTGQIRVKSQGNFTLLDVEGPTQMCFADLDKVLYFQKVVIPKNILPKQFHPLLKFEFNPLPEQNLRDPENGLKGLENIGNSCYLNSCMQCLSFTQELVSVLTISNTLKIINFEGKDGVVLAATGDLFKSLWSKDSVKRIFPRKFKKTFGQKNIQFSDKTQEDAHQFLLCLLNNLHQELKSVNSSLLRTFSKLEITTDKKKVGQYFQKHEIQKNKSQIMNLVRGKIHNTMDCSFCKSQSHSYDIFLALTLPIIQQQSKFIDIYLCTNETKLTKKFRIHVLNITKFDDFFPFVKNILPKKVLQTSTYIFGEINKENLMFKELGLVIQQKIEFFAEISLEELVTKAEKNDYILYQIKKKEEGEVLILIEYRYEKDGLIIGFPRFMQIRQTKVKDTLYYLDLKRDIAENDKQNFFRSYDIDNLVLFKLKESSKIEGKGEDRIIDYIVQVIFRQKEKLFSGTTDLYEEFNDPNVRYTIYDCFDLMRAPEVLEGSWQCGHCKKKQKVEKRQEIVEANSILILHLKRFKADYRKIKTMIDYPVKNLDISPWIEGRDESNTYRYDLYAVCLHTGTAEYGHYKAYCKHFVSGDWFEFDDGTVQKILESDVVTPSAYMLFYRRVQLQ